LLIDGGDGFADEVKGCLLVDKHCLLFFRSWKWLRVSSGRANKRGVTKFCGHFQLLILGHS
jgi:hypothetical protein